MAHTDAGTHIHLKLHQPAERSHVVPEVDVVYSLVQLPVQAVFDDVIDEHALLGHAEVRVHHLILTTLGQDLRVLLLGVTFDHIVHRHDVRQLDTWPEDHLGDILEGG